MKKLIICLMVLSILSFSISPVVYAYNWKNCATNSTSSWDADVDTITYNGELISVDVRLTILDENRNRYEKYVFARFTVDKNTLQFKTSTQEAYDINRNFVSRSKGIDPQYPKRGTIMYDVVYFIAN